MKIFITGASGYIGGSLAAALLAQGHVVSGLARSDDTAAALRKRGIAPVRGTLDDADVLAKAARGADATVNAANAGHRGAAEAMVAALAGSGKAFIHTSGSSIVGTRARGELVEAVFDEDTPFTPTPQRAARVEIDTMVRAAAGNGVRTAVIAPSLIYGRGGGLNPRQHPGAVADRAGEEIRRRQAHRLRREPLVERAHRRRRDALSRRDRQGAGRRLLLRRERRELDARDVRGDQPHARLGGRTQSMTVEDAAAEWGEGPANDTMGSNSRVRARRARAELGWRPSGAALVAEIERGCYAEEGRTAH